MFNTLIKGMTAATMTFALTGGIALAKPDGKGPATQPKCEHCEQKAQKDGDRGHHGPKHDKAHGREGHPMRAMFAKIDLNDEQKAQLKELHEQAREQRKVWWEEHQDEFKDLRSQMKEAREAKDREKMQELHGQVRELMESAPKPSDEKLQEILTDEQWAQFEQNRKEFREKMQNRRDKAGEGKDKAHRKHKDDGERKGKKRGGDKDDDDSKLDL